MAVSYKIIGRHIRAARKASNLTQEQVAEALKFSVAHYGRLERGEREINMDRLAQLSVLLNTPIERFVEGCIPDAPTIISETLQENPFLSQMAYYAQFCQEETLQRMLRYVALLLTKIAGKADNHPLIRADFSVYTKVSQRVTDLSRSQMSDSQVE